MISSIAILATATVLQTPQVSAHIILDGEFDDWNAVPATIVDPADAPGAFIDFGELRIIHDDRFVHLLADFGKTVNAQGLAGTAMLLLNADGDEQTGTTVHDVPGVDVIVDLSPEKLKYPGEFQGVGLRSTTYLPDPNDPAKPALNPYDIGFAFAPTHAGRRFELRFERGRRLPQTPPLFSGAQFTGKLVFMEAAGKPADITQPFTHELTISHPMRVDPPALPKRDADAFRVVSWNVQRGAIFSQGEPFRRVLRALDPDVVLLVELNDENTVADVERFFAQAFPERGAWHAVVGKGGGDLRCAVASRFPLAPAPELELVSMPHQPDKSVRVMGASIDVFGRKLLAVATHLKCCGSAGGPEDQIREVEVGQIRHAVKLALGQTEFDGLVIGGDLNLVGARDPLELLARGLDLDRSALAIPQTYQLDGLSNATWADRNQPFIPGRLDYILHSDSTIDCLHGFVFDSQDPDQTWRDAHQVQPGDTAAASDHLPVVLDLRWNAPESTR
jgi:endonuclease/exonuclease/phosphatase family metal-dependent hydrolase